MARSTEDVIEEEVRRRLADRLASAGVDQGRVSLEVLYMLPPEFVREYTRLFHKALREDLAGNGGGMGKDEGQIKKKAGVVKRHRRVRAEKGEDGYEEGEDRAVPGSDRGAQAGGKRYKNHWIVKDETALEVKVRVDRKLVRLIQSTARDLGNAGGGSARDSSGRYVRDT